MSNDESTQQAVSPNTETSEASDQIESTTTLPGGLVEPDVEYPSTWIDVPAPENCMCSDGSSFTFKVREADPARLAIVLSDGKFCHLDRTCRNNPGIWYDGVPFPENSGIFDFSNWKNPFADYSFVIVPNCTLDGLTGNVVADYLQSGKVNHNGHVNASEIVSWASTRFPTAESISVIGFGTGSMAAPSMSALVTNLLPNADIDMIIDSGGAMPDSFAGVKAAWGFLSNQHPAQTFASLTYESLTMTSTLELIASEFPDIRIARINFAEDSFIRRDAESIGYRYFDMKQNILQGEQRVEESGVAISTWIAPGSDHLALDGSSLFEIRFGEVRLIDWLSDFVSGRVVDDQVCSICTM